MFHRLRFTRLPKPVQYFIVCGAFLGGGALLLHGVWGVAFPPENASLMHWLSSFGFLIFIAPLTLKGAFELLRRTRGEG